ncbi:hypothetical protein CFOL_v3_20125 [Cephalotus follicularis]|uniref:Uncharacterized protein n=1 Tax=Cephalotus follicularis TaxID=3775 RepID=A0A1Q3C953_CEPFO|nr:hypothetical protein CFOL_v3_20125 [Cephalotus follicularis]
MFDAQLYLAGPLVYDGVLCGNCPRVPYLDLRHTMVYDGMLSVSAAELLNYPPIGLCLVADIYIARGPSDEVEYACGFFGRGLGPCTDHAGPSFEAEVGTLHRCMMDDDHIL